MKSYSNKFLLLLGFFFVITTLTLVAQTKTTRTKKSVKNVVSAKKGGAKKVPVKSVPFSDSFSYALGLNYAKYILTQGITVNPKDIAKGMADVIGKKTPAIKDEEVQKIIQKVARKAMDNIVAGHKKAFAKLLEDNKKNPKIKEIVPGLQYEVLKDSTGVIPTDTSMVKVHYTGKLLTGEVFDSSENRGEPVTFRVDQVIQGWQVALKKMHKGEVWKIFIASDLAYGDKGYNTIPGGAGLIFTVQLLDVK